MHSSKKLLFFVLSLTINGLFAQNFQLAGINYTHFTKTQIKESPTHQEVKFREFSFFAKLPIKFKNPKTVLVNTLQYNWVQPTAYSSPLFVATEAQKNLHNLSYSLTWVQHLNKKWSAVAVLMPTFASDFEKPVSGNGFFLQGTLLASAKMTDKLTLGGGGLYTAQLGDPQFLPVVQLQYRHQKHFVNVLLPSFVSYMYTLDAQEKWQLGVRLATNGGNFGVNNQDFAQVIPNSINKILYSRVNAGAIVHWQCSKTLLLEASGGLSLARKYTLRDASQKSYNYNSDNGAFFNLGVILTAPPKEIKN